ncbi:MAG: phosphoglycerate mutase [Betaproteobacteria bacterium]|nr:phosphoglycerate mutase [Betaproteobacteria bacterium]
MQCTLLIPHLLWPEAAASEPGGDCELPALEQILARARRQSFPAIPVEAWLCQAFEVERQQDWPVAPLTLAIDGGEPGEGYWLRADPVHVRAQREELRLADDAIGKITQHEADTLVAALNAHLAADALKFIAPHPARWYLKVAPAPALATHTLSEAAGADVTRLLPSGADALEWHRVGNEIQMLLHDHPINAEREARGAVPINSVWLWGGGTQPPVPGRHFCAVWSSDALAIALAAAADLDSAPAPAGASQWLTAAGDSGCESHFVLLDRLAAPARYGDLNAWREGAAALERHWFAPLAPALGDRGLERLTLVSLDRAGCKRFDLTPADRWRFWRRPRPLGAYCES